MAGPPTLRKPHQALVFPVRAEHKDEFRALMAWGKNTGLNTIGFLHADTDVGRMHLDNVRIIGKELGVEVVVALPFKGDVSDAQVDDMAKSIVAKQPAMFLNHGSAGLYQKLVTKAKNNGVRTTFMGVNSGSSQIAKGLGPLAQGMVFAQVVPDPTARKREITREYQDAARKADPRAEFSYGALEGYITAKVLVQALRETGKQLTRASLLKTLENAKYDLGGVTVRYAQGDHEGLQPHLGDEQAVEQPDGQRYREHRDQRRRHAPAAVSQEPGHEGADQADDRSDGKVDPARDDDEGHPDADNAEERGPADQVLQVVGADEPRVHHRGEAEHKQQQSEDAEQFLHAEASWGTGRPVWSFRPVARLMTASSVS